MVATFHYTVDDSISTITYANGETATYSYDTRDRPTQIDVTKTGGVKEMDLNYTYDGANNVLSIGTETYKYNWLNEMNSTTGPWGTITYTYDGAGNILTKTKGTTTTYSYGSYNRLNSAGKVNFTYASNGNMLTMANGTSSWTYGYNYENQMTSTKLGGTTVATFSYDGSGILVKSVETNTQVFAYQGNNKIFAKNTGTSSISKNFYANGLLVATVNGSATSYFHEDALGSIRLETSSGLVNLWTSDFQPYGALYGSSGYVSFQYTGKPKDPANGLYYSLARWYNAGIGRFVTEDSYGGVQSDPISLNRYSYAYNNPMSNVDPSGNSGGGSGRLATTSLPNVSPTPHTLSRVTEAGPPIMQQAQQFYSSNPGATNTSATTPPSDDSAQAQKMSYSTWVAATQTWSIIGFIASSVAGLVFGEENAPLCQKILMGVADGETLLSDFVSILNDAQTKTGNLAADVGSLILDTANSIWDKASFFQKIALSLGGGLDALGDLLSAGVATAVNVIAIVGGAMFLYESISTQWQQYESQ